MTNRRHHRLIDQPIRDLATHPHDLITVHVLAEYLQVADRTVVRMIADGILPADKVGKEWRIPMSGVRRVFPALSACKTA